MANRRMISKSISISKRLAKVSDGSALLYTWLIPHCDDNGNMDGDTLAVKGTVVPMRPVSIDEVDEQLKELASVEAILFYEHNGERYLHIDKFEDHQTLRGDRPDLRFPPCGLPTVYQRFPEGKLNLTEHNLTKQNRIDHEKSFETFWQVYPKKVAKAKAIDIWKRKGYGIIVDEIVKFVVKAKETDQWRDMKYIPHPTTFLNQKRWEDDLNSYQRSGRRGGAVI